MPQGGQGSGSRNRKWGGGAEGAVASSDGGRGDGSKNRPWQAARDVHQAMSGERAWKQHRERPKPLIDIVVIVIGFVFLLSILISVFFFLLSSARPRHSPSWTEGGS